MKQSYLIGDSPLYGNDQILSGTIRYNSKGLFNNSNQRVINKAREYARREGFNNIRIVTVYYKPIIIQMGIIGWKKVKETVKSYKWEECNE